MDNPTLYIYMGNINKKNDKKVNEKNKRIWFRIKI